MNLYFDKNNVVSFIEQKTEEGYGDCLRMMQKQFDIFFNFEKSELVSNELLLAWFKFFTSGVGKKNKQEFISPLFPERPLKSNTYINFNTEELSSVYLIDDEKADVLKNMGAILIGNVGEELKTLRLLLLQNEDYKFERKFKIKSEEFSNWSDLEVLSLNTSDVLIVDPYICSIQDLIEINLIPLLSILLAKSRCKINIVFYVNTAHYHLSADDISTIKRAVKKVTQKKVHITIVKYIDQRGYDTLAEHDRTIFTNYCRIYSGDTFNYFKKDGSKHTKGREIHFSSLADRENHDLAKELIEDLQKNLDRLDESAVTGDKKSNFLLFK